MSKKKVTKDDLLKMWRKAKRELDPKLLPATINKTSKKDKAEKQKNTIKEWE